MARVSFRTASVTCLAIWAVVWFSFLLLRFVPLDIRNIPGIGMIVLVALAMSLLALILAAGFAGAALIRPRPRARLSMLIFGVAVTALFGQACLFLITRWL